MRIGINGTFWDKPQTGSGLYVRELVSAIAACAPNDEYDLIVPGGSSDLSPSAASISTVTVAPAIEWSGENPAKVWFEQVTFPRACRRRGANLVHVPYFASPFVPSMRTVVTIHDLIPLLLPVYRGSLLVRLYTRLVATAAHRADQVLADSECTKQDIVQRLGIPAARIHVVYLAANERYRPVQNAQDVQKVQAKYGLPEKMLLYLGGYDQRKNLSMLLTVWKEASDLRDKGYRLVLAGALPQSDSALFPDPKRITDRLGLAGAIQYIGAVPEEDKPALYASATAFLFPSLYEGFGLPPLEAMACGAPVICSKAGSLPEVTGDAAVSVEARQTSQWVEALRRVTGDADLRQNMRERGIAQAARFSWGRAARETASVYRKALAA